MVIADKWLNGNVIVPLWPFMSNAGMYQLIFEILHVNYTTTRGYLMLDMLIA